MSTSELACSECRNLIGGYVLDALEPDEAESVARHIDLCPECAAEYARLASIPDLLALTADTSDSPEQPPAALEEAVLDRFAREHRARTPRSAPTPWRRRLAAVTGPFRRPLPAAMAGALAAAAVTAALAVAIGGSGGSEAPGHDYQASLAGTPAAPAAHAFAKLETSASGTAVHLDVKGLRPRPEDLYELWCIRDDGTKISAGTFRVDSRGRAYARLTTAAQPGEYHRLSIERRTPPAKGGQRVLAGEIQYGRTS